MNTPSYPTLRLAEGQRLSTTGLFERVFRSSPPNTGKSYAAVRAAYRSYEEDGTPFVFAADTTALADDLFSTHAPDLPNLRLFHSDHPDDTADGAVITT